MRLDSNSNCLAQLMQVMIIIRIYLILLKKTYFYTFDKQFEDNNYELYEQVTLTFKKTTKNTLFIL